MRDTRSHDAQGGRSSGGIHTEAQADRSAALAACSRTDHCRLNHCRLEGLKAGRVRIFLLMPEVLVTLPHRAYPTDLTDTQWRVLEPLIPPVKPGGRR
jgi:hypothetical protein